MTNYDDFSTDTLLDLASRIASTLVNQNFRVRLFVEGSMSTGIFYGRDMLITLVRSEYNDGEQKEGVWKEHVAYTRLNRKESTIKQDDVFLIICPQSMIGVDYSNIEALSKIVDAAGDCPVIILNPDIVDKVSTQGE